MDALEIAGFIALLWLALSLAFENDRLRKQNQSLLNLFQGAVRDMEVLRGHYKLPPQGWHKDGEYKNVK